jgi:hypothetical protein
MKKNRLKFKKNRPVWFGFGFIRLKLKKPNRTEKTESNWKKPSQTEKFEPSRFEPVFFLKNRTETGRFEPVSVFFKKNFNLVIFFYKNRTESKIIIPNQNCNFHIFLSSQHINDSGYNMKLTV